MDGLNYGVIVEYSKLKFYVTEPTWLGLPKLLEAKCFVGRHIWDEVSYKILHECVLLKDEYFELINYNFCK
jgi:hypothetical protein